MFVMKGSLRHLLRSSSEVYKGNAFDVVLDATGYHISNISSLDNNYESIGYMSVLLPLIAANSSCRGSTSFQFFTTLASSSSPPVSHSLSYIFLKSGSSVSLYVTPLRKSEAARGGRRVYTLGCECIEEISTE